MGDGGTDTDGDGEEEEIAGLAAGAEVDDGAVVIGGLLVGEGAVVVGAVVCVPQATKARVITIRIAIKKKKHLFISISLLFTFSAL